jgi:hypothetical protein
MQRVEVVELSLAALDALEVEAVAVLVGAERPLQGLPGLVDWRLCGALTRALQGGLYQAAPDEALLLPTDGRLRARRVVALGLPVPNLPDQFAAAARRACEVLARAGCHGFATALPSLEGGDARLAARLWLEAMAASSLARLVLLGEPRALLADLGAARAELQLPIEVVAPGHGTTAVVR